jgi:hypothetical protein
MPSDGSNIIRHKFHWPPHERRGARIDLSALSVLFIQFSLIFTELLSITSKLFNYTKRLPIATNINWKAFRIVVKSLHMPQSHTANVEA